MVSDVEKAKRAFIVVIRSLSVLYNCCFDISRDSVVVSSLALPVQVVLASLRVCSQLAMCLCEMFFALFASPWFLGVAFVKRLGPLQRA